MKYTNDSVTAFFGFVMFTRRNIFSIIFPIIMLFYGYAIMYARD